MYVNLPTEGLGDVILAVGEAAGPAHKPQMCSGPVVELLWRQGNALLMHPLQAVGTLYSARPAIFFAMDARKVWRHGQECGWQWGKFFLFLFYTQRELLFTREKQINKKNGLSQNRD